MNNVHMLRTVWPDELMRERALTDARVGDLLARVGKAIKAV